MRKFIYDFSGDSDILNSLKNKGNYETKLLQFDINPKRIVIFSEEPEVAEKIMTTMTFWWNYCRSFREKGSRHEAGPRNPFSNYRVADEVEDTRAVSFSMPILNTV